MESAVEAAARALSSPIREWDHGYTESERQKIRAKARAAISAAKPHLEAELADTVARLEKVVEAALEQRAANHVFRYAKDAWDKSRAGGPQSLADAALVLGRATVAKEQADAAMDAALKAHDAALDTEP